MRRRNELRELAYAVGAGMNGSEAIDQSLPVVKPREEVTRADGFESERWWETFGGSDN